MTVTAAAKLIGVGRPALSNLLNGNADLSSEMAARLAKAFGADERSCSRCKPTTIQHRRKSKAPTLAVGAYAPSFLQIKAREIEAWADGNITARAELGAFLRRVVASTAAQLTKLDFPAFDNSQRHGWDGFTEADAATPWVPLGAAGWEFGVNENPAQKAEQDYQARLSLKPKERKEVTFIFVTPRNWPGKDAWVASKRKKGDWKDVRAYDASDLEQWLEQSIPAQAWMAERLPLGTQGIQSLDMCWSEFASVTDPKLSKTLFRDAAEMGAHKLHAWLAKPAQGPFTIAAESTEEALGFLAAAFEREPLASENAGDRVVVVRSAEAVSKLEGAATSLIAVLASREAELTSAGLHERQHTIVVTKRSAIGEDDPEVKLDLVDEITFRDALREMGVDDARIDRLDHESGHSLTVLRRRLATIDAIKQPPWAADRNVAERLIPLALVGAWNADGDADQAVLAAITGGNYDTVEKTVADLLGTEQSPVWSAGAFRGVVSKTDAFYAIHQRVTKAELKRFFDVARVVLSESDPALTLPEDQRWAANLYGKSRRHSGALRRGLCETLVFLAVHGDRLFIKRLGYEVGAEVRKLVRELLTPLDPTTWQSQQHDLPLYAEAAPETFLDIIDEDLRSTAPKVHVLMQPAKGAFSFAGRTGLLWALESIAWSPRLLPPRRVGVGAADANSHRRQLGQPSRCDAILDLSRLDAADKSDGRAAHRSYAAACAKISVDWLACHSRSV